MPSHEVAQQNIQNLPSACLGTFLACIQLAHHTYSPPIRGFCDTGSQLNLISESCVQSLQLTRNKTKVVVTGIGPADTNANGFVTITLVNCVKPNQCLNVQAIIVPRITDPVPAQAFTSPFTDDISKDELADPLHHRPGRIDLLLGAGAWADIINDEIQRKSTNGHQAVAQSTLFGWVIFGQMYTAAHTRLQSCHSMAFEDARVDELLIKYWNADLIPEQRQWTREEQRAENIFVTTHQRDNSGRYIVNIPLKEDVKPLGNSYRSARACFLAVEKRLQRNPHLFAFYKAVFDDYRTDRQMILTTERPPDDAESYIMPHHPINVTGQKGKPRVVFNASALTQTGISFNDQQLAGPKLQDDERFFCALGPDVWH